MTLTLNPNPNPKADGSVTEGMWRDGLLIPLWQR